MTKRNMFLTDTFFGLKTAGMTDVCGALGIFDGVHAGHRLVIQNLIRMAEDLHCEPVILTFAPHPRQVLDPEHAPTLLLPPERKAEILAECGVHAVVTIPFTGTLSAMSAEDFLNQYILSAAPSVRLRGLCVGKRFRCGYQGKGTTDVLAAYADKKNICFQAVPEQRVGDEIVSSSSIRQAEKDGDLRKVETYMCGPHTLFGYVERGNGIAASELRTPTANLHVEFGILPPNGVYAASAVTEEGRELDAAVNIGTAPTYTDRNGDAPVRTEVHLIGYAGNLYGQRLEVRLRKQIRTERKFESSALLKAQIFQDVTEIQKVLRKEHGHVGK